MHKKAEGSTKESTKESTKKVEGLRGKGRSGTSVVTRPPVCASLTSGGSLSGVVGGGVVPSGSSGSCEVPPHDLICGRQGTGLDDGTKKVSFDFINHTTLSQKKLSLKLPSPHSPYQKVNLHREGAPDFFSFETSRKDSSFFFSFFESTRGGSKTKDKRQREVLYLVLKEEKKERKKGEER